MTAPRLEINLEKIKHNARELQNLFSSKGISITAVTKGVLGSLDIVHALIESGITSIANPYIASIRKMKEAGVDIQSMLIRPPMMSEIEEVVKYADISLNSEICTIKLLSEYALKCRKNHKVILMVEMGDLREGILPCDIERTVEEIIDLQGIDLIGIGANMACLSGAKPTVKNMAELSCIAEQIQRKNGIELEIVSGGNSANYEWFISTDDVGLINNLRLGEAILLGCETLYRKKIPNLYTDVFTLVAEVIELKTKYSKPAGEICQDSFGNKLEFQDRGYMRRAVLGIGKQDIDISRIKPRIDTDIIGASSDHLVLDAKETDLRVGSEVEFDVNYSTLLKLMPSPYVEKMYFSDQPLSVEAAVKNAGK